MLIAILVISILILLELGSVLNELQKIRGRMVYISKVLTVEEIPMDDR